MTRRTHRRQVFIVPGFDPRGARLYQRMISTAITEHAGGLDLIQHDAMHWSTQESGPEGIRCHSDHRICDWSDLVQQDWRWSRRRIIAEAWAGLFRALTSSTSRRIFRLSRGVWVSRLAPPIFVLVTTSAMRLGMISSIIIIVLATWSWAADTETSSGANGATSSWPWLWLGGAGLALVLAFTGRWLWQREARWRVLWLLKTERFIQTAASRGWPDALQQRLHTWQQDMHQAMADPDMDEVVVIGHSVGSLLLPSLLTSSPMATAVMTTPSKLVVVSLGQLIPDLALWPQAGWYRQQLSQLRDYQLWWFDFSSPADGACFARVDPISLQAGNIFTDNPCRRILRNPAFHRCYDDVTYQRLKADKLAYHMLYYTCGGPDAPWCLARMTGEATPLSKRLAATPEDGHAMVDTSTAA